MRAVLMGPVPVPACQYAASVTMILSLEHLAGRLERYPAATKCVWAVRAETRRPVRLISSTLILDDDRNLFLLMIRIRAPSSLGVDILNRCPCGGLWPLDSSSGFANTTEDSICHLVTLMCSSTSLPLWARGPQRLGWGAELTHTATGEW